VVMNSLKRELSRKYERDNLEGGNKHTVSLTVKKGIKDSKTSTWSQNPFIIFKSLPACLPATVKKINALGNLIIIMPSLINPPSSILDRETKRAKVYL